MSSPACPPACAAPIVSEPVAGISAAELGGALASFLPRDLRMAQAERAQVLWRFHQWRCEYAPISPERGIFRLYDADVRVIEAECSPRTALGDFAQSCRALVETAEHRR